MRITWIKALTDNDETPVNHQFFDMAEPLVTMIEPPSEEHPNGVERTGIRRNSYIYRLMIEAGYTEARQ